MVGPATSVELEPEEKFPMVSDEDADDEALDVPIGSAGAVRPVASVTSDLDSLLVLCSVEPLLLYFVLLSDESPVLKWPAVGKPKEVFGNSDVSVLTSTGPASSPVDPAVLE